MLGSGDRVALATVVDTRRSAPRPLGSRLALSSRGEMVSLDYRYVTTWSVLGDFKLMLRTIPVMRRSGA